MVDPTIALSELAIIVRGALMGVAVYTIGQILSKFFIEPIYEIRKTVGEIRFNLDFHAPAIHNPIARTEEASNAAEQALLKSSCDLISKLHAVPAYNVARHLAFGALPQRQSIENAAAQLRALSSCMHETGAQAHSSKAEVAARVEKIMRFLRLEQMPGDAGY
jgi:hypothetical protein